MSQTINSETKTSPFVMRMPAAFWWTVRVPLPVENSYEVATLDLQFKPLPQARIDQFRGLGLTDSQVLPTEREICHEVVCGWRHLADESGVVQGFSTDGLERLLDMPVMRASIVTTYLTVMSGMAARKNA